MQPKDHIHSIRSNFFGIDDNAKGDGSNVDTKKGGLSRSLHNAAKILADQLYSRDLHFLFELIQNACDNSYSIGTVPTLSFHLLTEKDPTSTPGSCGALIVWNNEVGFTRNDVDALSSIGESTKLKANQFIGEKGIGFKATFQVTTRPHIISNGYQFCFSSEPDPKIGLGYIVPRWVDGIDYAFEEKGTTIILPLRAEKAALVEQQLTSLSDEVLLFLPKLKRLQIQHNNSTKIVIERNECPLAVLSSLQNKTAVREVELQTNINENISSKLFILSESKFDVPGTVQLSERDTRGNAKERTVQIAFIFPRNDQDHISTKTLFAYLPTEIEFHFPFLLNADFVLTANREGVLWDRPWNQWLVNECVPTAYLSGFEHVMKAAVASEELDLLVTAVNAIPCEQNNKYSDGLATLQDSILTKLRERPCLPTENWNLLSPISLRTVGHVLRKLLFNSTIAGGPSPTIFTSTPAVMHSLQERFKPQIRSVGVNSLSDSEWKELLKDSDWILGLPVKLYLDLLEYLSVTRRKLTSGIALLRTDSSHLHESLPQLPVVCQPPVPYRWVLQSASALVSKIPIRFIDSKVWDEIQENEQWQKDVLPFVFGQLGLLPLNANTYANSILSTVTEGWRRRNQIVFESGDLIAASRFLCQAWSRSELEKSVLDHVRVELPIVSISGEIVYSNDDPRREVLLLPPSSTRAQSSSSSYELPLWCGITPIDRTDITVLSNEYLYANSDKEEERDQNVQMRKFISQVLGAVDLLDTLPVRSRGDARSGVFNVDFKGIDGINTTDKAEILLEWLTCLVEKQCNDSDWNSWSFYSDTEAESTESFNLFERFLATRNDWRYSWECARTWRGEKGNFWGTWIRKPSSFVKSVRSMKWMPTSLGFFAPKEVLWTDENEAIRQVVPVLNLSVSLLRRVKRPMLRELLLKMGVTEGPPTLDFLLTRLKVLSLKPAGSVTRSQIIALYSWIVVFALDMTGVKSLDKLIERMKDGSPVPSFELERARSMVGEALRGESIVWESETEWVPFSRCAWSVDRTVFSALGSEDELIELESVFSSESPEIVAILKLFLCDICGIPLKPSWKEYARRYTSLVLELVDIGSRRCSCDETPSLGSLDWTHGTTLLNKIWDTLIESPRVCWGELRTRLTVRDTVYLPAVCFGSWGAVSRGTHANSDSTLLVSCESVLIPDLMDIAHLLSEEFSSDCDLFFALVPSPSLCENDRDSRIGDFYGICESVGALRLSGTVSMKNTVEGVSEKGVPEESKLFNQSRLAALSAYLHQHFDSQSLFLFENHVRNGKLDSSQLKTVGSFENGSHIVDTLLNLFTTREILAETVDTRCCLRLPSSHRDISLSVSGIHWDKEGHVLYRPRNYSSVSMQKSIQYLVAELVDSFLPVSALPAREFESIMRILRAGLTFFLLSLLQADDPVHLLLSLGIHLLHKYYDWVEERVIPMNILEARSAARLHVLQNNEEEPEPVKEMEQEPISEELEERRIAHIEEAEWLDKEADIAHRTGGATTDFWDRNFGHD